MGHVTTKTPLANSPANNSSVIYNLLHHLCFFLEKYNPPENITVYDNESHHIIQWDNPEIRFDIATHMLYYKLDIQKKVRTPNLWEEPQTTCTRLSPVLGRMVPNESGILLQKAVLC